MTDTRRRLLAIAVISYLAVLGLNRSLVVVRGGSMAPTLQPGDRLLTLRARPSRLRTGKLVVLHDPRDDDHLVVKRLVALTDGTADVRGDAPDASTDSRSWGRVPVGRIRRVVLIRLPLISRGDAPGPSVRGRRVPPPPLSDGRRRRVRSLGPAAAPNRRR